MSSGCEQFEILVSHEFPCAVSSSIPVLLSCVRGRVRPVERQPTPGTRTRMDRAGRRLARSCTVERKLYLFLFPLEMATPEAVHRPQQSIVAAAPLRMMSECHGSTHRARQEMHTVSRGRETLPER